MKTPAKDRFREGWIMTTRPFQFVETGPIQKFSIFYGYSERPVIREVLTLEAKQKIKEIEDSSWIAFMGRPKEEWMEEKIGEITNDSRSFEEDYEGEILQVYMGDAVIRLFPDEYNILSDQKVSDIMSMEGYHTITTPQLKTLKDFIDQKHYLQSRGIDDHTATRMVSTSFKGTVYYKPYFELLDQLARNNEIIPDPFYKIKEGIEFETVLNRETGKNELFYTRT